MEWAIHQRGLDDLVLLDAIDEEHVCAILKQRFLSDGQMYTYAGPALVAINPYKVGAGRDSGCERAGTLEQACLA